MENNPQQVSEEQQQPNFLKVPAGQKVFIMHQSFEENGETAEYKLLLVLEQSLSRPNDINGFSNSLPQEFINRAQMTPILNGTAQAELAFELDTGDEKSLMDNFGNLYLVVKF